MSSMILPQGMPSLKEYLRLRNEPIFGEMEIFSNKFLSTYANVFKHYPWSSDSFHHWSREWEYPFVYCRIVQEVGSHKKEQINILDLGSGFTFFPYYLQTTIPGVHVLCADSDASLAGFFTETNRRSGLSIPFTATDIRTLPYPDSSIDIAYCISVLEHTERYEEILADIRRVLRPGGLLILTFDISIDGTTDIPPAAAKRLLKSLQDYFVPIEPLPTSDMHDIKPSNDLTTEYFLAHERKLLPWKPSLRRGLYLLKEIVLLRKPRKAFRSLTVYCAALRKN